MWKWGSHSFPCRSLILSTTVLNNKYWLYIPKKRSEIILWYNFLLSKFEVYCNVLHSAVSMCSSWPAKWCNRTLGLLRALISWFHVASSVVSSHSLRTRLQQLMTSLGWFALIIFTTFAWSGRTNSWSPRSSHLSATFVSTCSCKSFTEGRSLPVCKWYSLHHDTYKLATFNTSCTFLFVFGLFRRPKYKKEKRGLVTLDYLWVI